MRKICIVSIVLLISLYNLGYSQERENNKKPGESSLFIGFSIGPSHSQINNEGSASISKLINTAKYSYFGAINIGYFFSKSFAFSSGIGFISYNSESSIDSYQNKLNSIDSENDQYELQVSANGIKEIQKVKVLNIPVSLIFRIPISNKIGFFLQPGMSLIVPLSQTYSSSGIFTYKGYYALYDILLENLPSYGFSSNKSINSDGKLDLISNGFNAFVSAGFDFAIRNNIKIAIGGNFDKSLSNFSKYAAPDNFQLSKDVNKINSLMGGSAKATMQSLGLVLSLCYHFK